MSDTRTTTGTGTPDHGQPGADGSTGTDRRSEPRRRLLLGALAPLVTIGVAIGLWALVTMVLAGPESNVSYFNPLDAFKALGTMIGEGVIWTDIRVSLMRLGSGLGLAAIIGIPVGIAVGAVPVLDRATSPLFQFIRMISPVAWTPVAIVVLGVGSAPAIALIALTAVWPLIINTSAGVKAIPTGWPELARSLGATRVEVFTTIVVPAIRQPVLTGLRVALGVGWIVLVPVEMLGSSEGLGYAIVNAKDALQYADLMAIIMIVGALGFVLDAGLRRLSRT